MGCYFLNRISLLPLSKFRLVQNFAKLPHSKFASPPATSMSCKVTSKEMKSLTMPWNVRWIPFFDDFGHYSNLHLSLLKNIVALSENIAQLTSNSKEAHLYSKKNQASKMQALNITKPYCFRLFWGSVSLT